MKLIHLFIFTFSLLITSQVYSKEGVAKVLIAKGKVYDLGTKKRIKKGQWIKEGVKILTKNRSFVKLLFIDKSQMSLGPNSEMVISKFPKKKAGIITLMKGQLRSKVTKNYMEMTDKEKSKLFIKTRTAAMGVRGTDFQVNFNPENMNTSLITFEGAVAMGTLKDIDKIRNKRADQDHLERIVSAPTAVLVKKGQFSGVMPGVDSKPLVPTKINTKQIKKLEANDGSKFKEQGKKAEGAKEGKKPKKKAVRNILPPGVKGAEFAGASKSEIADNIEKVDIVTAKQIAAEATPAGTEQKDGAFPVEEKPLLKEGGYVDTSAVIYIPPPENAPVDPMTQEIIMPETIGYIDDTGQFENDAYKLTSTGEWVLKDPNITTDDGGGRTPASTTDGDGDGEPLPPPPPPPTCADSTCLAEPTLEPLDPINPDGTKTCLDCAIDDTLDDRDDTILDTQEDTTTNPKTRVRVIIQ